MRYVVMGTPLRMSPQDPRHPTMSPDLGEVPSEEGLSQADAADRVDRDPEAEQNATDPVEIARSTVPEDG